MTNSLRMEKLEELVEIFDILTNFKNIDDKKDRLFITVGSVWKYNKNSNYACTVKEVHDGCLDVLMGKEWSGEPYHDNLLIGFFEEILRLLLMQYTKGEFDE